MGTAWNEHECRGLIDEYQEDGIVERHEVVNRNNPDWPTSAIRLIRINETVRPLWDSVTLPLPTRSWSIHNAAGQIHASPGRPYPVAKSGLFFCRIGLTASPGVGQLSFC